MIESMITLAINLVAVGIAYGTLRQMVRSNKENVQLQLNNLQEQIDALHKKHEDIAPMIIQLKVDMEVIKNTLGLIVEQLKRKD